MKRSYHGNRKPYILVISHPRDQALILPVLVELDGSGLNLCPRCGQSAPKGMISRARAVLLFFSSALSGDKRLVTAAFNAKAAGILFICVNLDKTPLPEDLVRLMYASNSVDADRYENASDLAQRLLKAEGITDKQVTPAQLKSRKRRRLLLIVLALLALIAALKPQIDPIFRQIFPTPTPAPTATATPTPTPTPEPTPIPPDPALLALYRLTQADLDKIQYLVLAGDNRLNDRQHPAFEWNTHVWESEIDGKLVWLMDGQPLPRGTVTDLSLVGMMRNLRELVLINQAFTDFTPLASLNKLTDVSIYDSPVSDISPLGGAGQLRHLDLQLTRVENLSALEACKFLDSFIYRSAPGIALESLDGLKSRFLNHMHLMDADSLQSLSSLVECENLHSLIVQGAASLRDISALSALSRLNQLELHQTSRLKDLSPLASVITLDSLGLFDVPVSDLSPLAKLTQLRNLSLRGVPVSDLSFLNSLDNLDMLELDSTKVRSLKFLEGMDHKRLGSLMVWEPLDDYTGLSAVESYGQILLSMREKSFSALEGALNGVNVNDLKLFDCRNIDFAAIPGTVRMLTLSGGNLEDLSGLQHLPDLQGLELSYIEKLTSLDGMESCPGLRRLLVENCLRLTGWEALYTAALRELSLRNLVSLPDLARLRFTIGGDHAIALENLPQLTDLSFMDALPDDDAKALAGAEVRLPGLDQLINLEPVRRLKPSHVFIPPQLEEQAAAMQKDGGIPSYFVVYPQNSIWNNRGFELRLLSADELDTLPAFLLGKVTDLQLAGDHVTGMGAEYLERRWENDKNAYYIVNSDTGESYPAREGRITDMRQLSKLTGLERLGLDYQPLATVHGIQYLSKLKELYLSDCLFTDASPIFTLTQLQRLSITSTPITSLTGIQNLRHLQSLDLNDTKLTDISALRDGDLGYAYARDGFSLAINNIPCRDLSPLASVTRFNDLQTIGLEASRWLPHIAGKPVGRLLAHSCSVQDSDIALIAALKDLRELEIPYNQAVTDLTPLLACQTLERLYISADMRKALEAISGKAHFEIVMDESNFSLFTLDELDTLPLEQLAKVKTFRLAGDHLISEDKEHYERRWENNQSGIYIVSDLTGEASPAGEGIMANLGKLSKLTGLQRLELTSQPLESLKGIGQLTQLREASFSSCAFTDASALFALTQLERISLNDTPVTTLSGLQNLHSLKLLDINDSKVSDISALRDTDLSYAYAKDGFSLSINGIPCEDLSPLASVTRYNDLQTIGLDASRWLPHIAASGVTRLMAHSCGLADGDIALIASLKGLKDLEIPYNQAVTDLTPLLDCKSLERLFISADMRLALKDMRGKAPFEIVMDESNFSLLSLDELDTLPAEQLEKINSFALAGGHLLAGGVEWVESRWTDSGLEYYIQNNATGASAPAGEGFLKDLNKLVRLINLQQLELTAQPLESLQGIGQLTQLRDAHFSSCSVTDASALFALAQLERISLNDTPLTTLSGLQNLTRLEYLNLNDSKISDISALRETDLSYAYSRGGLSLAINGIPCPDLSPLQAVRQFSELHVIGMEASRWLPFLSGNGVGRLLAHSCGLADSDIALIASLEGLKDLEIPNNQTVTDLTPLLQCKTLERLFISADMRQALKDMRGNAHFEIVMDESNFSLLSLDELDTLPAELLEKINSFALAGGHLLAGGVEWVETRWSDKGIAYYIRNNATGESVPAGEGMLKDLNKLTRLTNLKRLELSSQPLESLQGIEQLTQLRDASFNSCLFSDASALFSLPLLERISLSATPVTGIAGLQNLRRLESLNLNDSKVSDISALRETDFSYAYGRGGLSLDINVIPCEDLSPLQAVRQFSELHVIGIEASRWLPHLASSTVGRLLAHNCSLVNLDIAQLAALTGLKELEIPDNQDVTDLRPLLGCAALERLLLSSGMEKAIKSIEGSASFEITVR